MNDIGPLPRDVEAARVEMALRSLLETVTQRSQWLTLHQELHGTPDSDSPTDALLVTLNAEFLELMNTVGVIGQVLANDLRLRSTGEVGS